ncbi:MAG: hypothetical protein M3440_02235, partial [Chloroflexota bacterium]|nr:hypothetical protein [Chloroflexota bacterium]
LVCQEPQGPAGLPIGGGRAGQRDQVRFLAAVQGPDIDAVGPLGRQGGGQSLGDELAPDALDGARMDIEGGGDGGVRPARTVLAVVGREQDQGARQHPGRAVPEPASVRNSARCAVVSATRYGSGMAGLQR